MSSTVETLNRGEVEDCGFIFGDVERVRLGALPAIHIDQFAEYSTDTLLQVLDSNEISSEVKDSIRVTLAFTCGRIHQAKINEINSEFSSVSREDPNAEIMEQIKANVIPRVANRVGNPERTYAQNPFVLENGKIIISNFYDIAIPEFVHFATHILAGGMSGWTGDVPTKVMESTSKLMKAARSKNA